MSLGAILTAIVTPFGPDGRIDEDAFVDLLHHLCAHGSDGVVVAGTTGEASTLDTETEHLRLVELACAERPAGATIVAGAGSNDTRHAVHMTERVTAAGADAVLSVTPYYNRPSRRGVLAHYREIARATDRPIVLYNIPQRTGLDLPNDLLAELAQLDRVEAVKQANAESVAPVDGLDLYAGNDDLLATVVDLGGPGGILTASHLVGDRMRAVTEAPTSEERHRLEAELLGLYAVLGRHPAAAALKAALRLLGRDVGAPRLPYVELDDDEVAELRTALAEHGLLEPARS